MKKIFAVILTVLALSAFAFADDAAPTNAGAPTTPAASAPAKTTTKAKKKGHKKANKMEKTDTMKSGT